MSRNKALMKTGASILGLSIAVAAMPAHADLLPSDVLLGTSGDGSVFADPDEGVVEPGVQAVTFTSSRVRDPANPGEFLYLEPFENIVTDFSGLGRRGETTNCLIASNPGIVCDSAPGSGKRVKILLTGTSPFDMILATTPSVDYPEVDYFTFGKVENFTGARITGWSVQLLDANGTRMDDAARAAAEAVLFNLDPAVIANLGNGARLVDGLFGAGGQEGDIGFFSDARNGFALTREDAALIFGALSKNPEYLDAFGNAMLADNMIPEGIFWDDDGDPTNEGALLAWYDHRVGAWVWGNVALPADVEARVQELADDLGVTVATTAVDALGYSAGDTVPADVVALMEANGLFATDVIEDLRNANMNFTITVGSIEEGQFIIRIAPQFADIVNVAGSELQFGVAAALDAANVPYLNADAAYAGDPLDPNDGLVIGNILALPTVAEQQMALESIGQSFMSAFGGLSYGMGSDALFALGAGGGGDAGMEVASQGTGRWAMSETASGFVSINGSMADYDRTDNGAAYDTNTVGVHGGVELSFSPEWSGGVMLSGLSGEADIMADRGEIEADGYGLTGFARFSGQAGSGRLNMSVAAGFQSMSYDITRNIAFGAIDETATADTDGTTFYAGIVANWMVGGGGGLQYGPMASLEYYDIEVDGYRETGAGIFNLDVGDYDTDMVVARLGAEGQYTSGNLEMGGHLALSNRSGGDGEVFSSFAGTALPGMSNPLDGMDDTWLDVGARVSMTLGDGNSRWGVQYGGALFADGFEEHRVGAFFEMQF